MYGRDLDLIVCHICSAGEVTAVGANVHDIKVGDRVAHVSFTAYSEYSALDANQVAKIPDNVSYKDAAAASAQALTALTLVRDAHHVKKGGRYFSKSTGKRREQNNKVVNSVHP